MEFLRLSDCAYFSSKRTKDISLETYISTENMLPNKGGVTIAESLPECASASLYEPSDILLSNIRPYFCKIWFADRKGSCSNDVLVIKTKTGFESRFIYYVLSDNNFFNYDSITSKGTKMPRGSKSAIMKYIVPDYSLSIQRRIASILSAYDNLIENNERRIRLLEQMAENLYKEWFVRYRFPGYETAEFENGLPKGWKATNLSEIGTFKRGKNITANEMVEGNIPVISAGIEPSGKHNCANVKGISVTISSSGANAGYISIHYSDIWAADCSYIDSKTSKYIFFAYEMLNCIRIIITNLQRGAAQPHVYPKDVNKIRVFIPTQDLIKKANLIFEVFHNRISNLQKQNRLLARERDLLLPRLMSGKLEVE